MSAHPQILSSRSSAEHENRDLVRPRHSAAARRGWFDVAWRYGISASGPIAISGAHFVASILFLRVSAPSDFGIFSFVLVVVPLALSLSGALLGAPIAGALNKGRAIDEAEMGTYLKANLAFSLAAGLAVFLALLASRAGIVAAVTLGLYGAAMTFRWFVRSLAYARHKPLTAVFSDLVYGGLVLAGLVALLLVGRLTLETAALALLGASVAGVAVFAERDLHLRLSRGAPGSLKGYLPVWRELTCWSFAGVLLTEMTSNAHAYFVTFASGPKAFALLAVGSLMMRPVSLVLTALPDMERPVMARKIGQKDTRGAFRTVMEFRAAAVAMLLVTAALGLAVLAFWPHLLIKPGYDLRSVFEVFAFWIAISFVRTLRTPDAVFLQAAQEFNALAGAGARSATVSLVATPILLFAFGPVVSLGGILLGDVAMTWDIFRLTRKWRNDHG
jgi:O-antigen/teichoic acid export membrane protein